MASQSLSDPPTLRHSEAGTAGRRVVEEVQCDRAMKTENFIVDPSHVEAGEGVRTCMPNLSVSSKSFACSKDCVDEPGYGFLKPRS